jgi:tetratricopeptide (TPR) repeat protein
VKLCQDAEEQLKRGDIENAKRNIDAALRSDPTLWPALFTRAKIFIRQHKYELAIQDCNGALRQYPGFIDAALLRANANAHLGRYMIDTLAAAYGETGDFDFAVRYEGQALGIKGISPESAKVFREHLMWFQQRRPFPTSNKPEKI